MFSELRRLLLAPGVLDGLDLADRLGLVQSVLPELAELHEVEQSHYHHLDVYGHTIEVLERQIELEGRLEEFDPRLRALLEAPLADELSALEALRFGALLHDVGKPATRSVRADGRITFMGHDRRRAHGGAGLPPAADEREAQPFPGGARPAPPAARLPGARASARPARRLPLSTLTRWRWR